MNACEALKRDIIASAKACELCVSNAVFHYVNGRAKLAAACREDAAEFSRRAFQYAREFAQHNNQGTAEARGELS